jgi:hypothetical protein
VVGGWFPAEYKTCPFKAGDLLAFKSEGRFALQRILTVDQVAVRKGADIQIQGRRFTAPEDDFLLIVGVAFSRADFDTIEEARAAAAARSWNVRIGHVARRVPGVGDGGVVVGHQPVEPHELEGYRMWKDAFDKGEAGVF